jgi:hypothetical protein
MEAEDSSETSVNFYQTTRSNIPENSHLHGHEALDSMQTVGVWALLPV